jgi:hypothetical protein
LPENQKKDKIMKKAILSLIPLLLIGFVMLIAAKEAPSAPPAPQDLCVQLVCVTDKGNPVAGCPVAVIAGEVVIKRITGEDGCASFSLISGVQYKAVPDCIIAESVEFTACGPKIVFGD